MKTEWISKAECSRRLGVSARMISKYIERGMPAEGGRVPWPKAQKWAAANVAPEKSGNFASRHPDTRPAETGVDETLSEAQRRKESALADLREMEAAEKRGQMVALTDVEAVWDRLTTSCRARLLSIPTKTAAAARTAATNEAARRLIEGAISEALDELSMTWAKEHHA
jgi:phage terminase Nu1 subunit (DNA packaging protein)